MRALRIALAVMGLAAALYGTASSTFGWPTRAWWTTSSGLRFGFEFSGAELIFLGLALAAFTLWPRKRKTVGMEETVNTAMPEVPLGRPERWPWKRALGRSYLIAALASLIGGGIAQQYVWPIPRGQDTTRLLMDSISAVSLVAGACDFLFSFLSWKMRADAEKVTASHLPNRP